MKKRFLLIPVGLIIMGGLIWLDARSTISTETSHDKDLLHKTPNKLFLMTQESLRLVLRHGDKESISVVKTTIGELEKIVPVYEKQGFNVNRLEDFIAQYKEDSMILSQAAEPYLTQLKKYDGYEKKETAKFLLAIDQIGLYELETEYKKLSKARINYLKEPSSALEEEYRTSAILLNQMIKELYLDDAIEDPLYAYLENHNGYFKTAVSYYKEAGEWRIQRLRKNSYAIKTELQLLPVI